MCLKMMYWLSTEKWTPRRTLHGRFTWRQAYPWKATIDYFAPLEITQGTSHVKRYGCFFTCLSTGAIHTEIAHSLGMASIVPVLGGFISICGCTGRIWSDQGTNLIRAQKKLKEAIEWNQQKVNSFCSQKGIEWIFNPPTATRMGSVWERMILSVMQILPPGMLKEETVSDEVLSSVLAEVVNVLNFKKLSCNSNSPQEEQPITPNYLLHLWSCPSPPPGVFSKDDNSSKLVRWQAQCLASPFWHRWIWKNGKRWEEP